MGCSQSTAKQVIDTKPTADEDSLEPTPGATSLAVMENLTSEAYNADHLPSDWRDTVFLIPHEWLRQEMEHMEQSAAALPHQLLFQNTWKALLFCEWISEYFCQMVHMHHDNEEKIYFPFLREHNAKIPEDRMASDHKKLIQELEAINTIAKDILKAKGWWCQDKIVQLKQKIPVFIKDMKEHIKEEEEFAPKAIRDAGITEEENDHAVERIIQAGGIEGLHKELPGVLLATQVWATPEFYEHFTTHEIPPPILKLAHDIFIPNMKQKWYAMRDAPLLDKEPTWTLIDFDPSMLPPPPPAAEETLAAEQKPAAEEKAAVKRSITRYSSLSQLAKSDLKDLEAVDAEAAPTVEATA